MSTQNSGNPETISSTILEACKSLKFWSAASASIGFLILIIGGITYLLADSLKDSGETVSLIGIALLILSVLLAPKTIARGIFSRYGRYGSTTIIMTLAFLAIVVIVYLMLLHPFHLEEIMNNPELMEKYKDYEMVTRKYFNQSTVIQSNLFIPQF